jgi:methylated-DNA-[protein]-cysteine S-methyltransferase
MQQYKMNSPVGPIYLVASEDGLHAVAWHQARIPLNRKAEGLIKDAVKQLEEYFAGKRKTFDLPLAPKGTDFQMRVWEQLRKIPYGVTKSYGEIARKIGQPTASRAVGAANGQNPLGIVVPCHRVIGSTGKLTGFAGGMKNKEYLLNLESGQTELIRPAD